MTGDERERLTYLAENVRLAATCLYVGLEAEGSDRRGEAMRLRDGIDALCQAIREGAKGEA